MSQLASGGKRWWDFSSPLWADYDGRMAFTVLAGVAPNDYLYVFVVGSILPGQTVPLRYLVQTGGIGAAAVGEWREDEIEGHFRTFPVIRDWLQSFALPVILGAIEELTDGDAAILEAASVTDPEGLTAHAWWCVRTDADYDKFYLTFEYRAALVSPGFDPTVAYGPLQPIQAQPPSAGGGIDTSAIVEALQEISTRRIEVAVNNGAAMFSVNGGTRSED